MDESQKRPLVVGAVLLGHQSSHQRANWLTAAPGVKHQCRWRNQRLLLDEQGQRRPRLVLEMLDVVVTGTFG
jgi:hypothetical protein